MIQKTEWGYIDWWYLPEMGTDRKSMNIGVTYLYAGKRQPAHIHYGHEQLLYVLEGEGIYYINGEEIAFKPGMHFYMEADSSHATINTGGVTVKELLVSNPVSYSSEIPMAEEESEAEDPKVNLYAAVEAIRVQILESMRLPFTIFDEAWSVVMQSKYFPKVCMKKCDPIREPQNCSCMEWRVFNKDKTPDCIEFTCSHGLKVYHFPIVYQGRTIGAVRGGHFFSSEAVSEAHDEFYDTPRSTEIGIRRLMRQMIRSILSYCDFYVSRQTLREKEYTIKLAEERKEILEQDLCDIKDTVTNLKINHHFLFNTLNCMAGMALSGDRDDLYNAVIDLSKMFRYTMTTDLQFVSLRGELEYLSTYLNLQRLRYGKTLNVVYDMAEECNGVLVPFNFLQPIVENAFTHGFMSYDYDKYIKIEVKLSGEYAVISACNNGVMPDEVTINRVGKSLNNHSGHGLSLIYDKLQSAYGTKFTMNISPGEESGICVTVRIPISGSTEREEYAPRRGIGRKGGEIYDSSDYCRR